MPRAPKISDEQLIELIEQGMNNAEIARQLDVPQANINTRCKQLRMRHEPLPTPEAAPEIDPGVTPEEEKAEEIEEEKAETLTYEEVMQGDMLDLEQRRYEVIGINSMGLVLRRPDGKTKGITAEAFTAAGFKRAQPEGAAEPEPEPVWVGEPKPEPEAVVEPEPEVAAEPDPEDEKGTLRLDDLILQKVYKDIRDLEDDKAVILAAVREGKLVPMDVATRYNNTIAKYLGVRR